MGQIVFAPLLPVQLIAVLAGFAALGIGLALWHRLAGWGLRALAALVVLAALAQPAWQVETRNPLTDIVLVVEDQSASQKLGDREALTKAATDRLVTLIEGRPNTEVRRVPLGDGVNNAGTRLMTTLSEALRDEPRGRVAGVLLLSDGRVHDSEHMPEVEAPVHLLMTGKNEDWDRRLIIRNAPSFAILGEEIQLTLQVEDQGAAPGATHTTIKISVDGEAPQDYRIPIGQELTLPVTLTHGGLNVIQFTVPTSPGELTDRNNSALVQINGVRDRLRVLLVSGEPHAGERTWRNLLKADNSVDLVHFTILRPLEKQDGTPVTELSLIAFPTRELFLEKINDFDLIIFDRYKRRGILPSIYLDNVRQYVQDGGAVLVAAGPDFASAESIYRSPLSEVLPAAPTAYVLDRGYHPTVSELGARHPVTADLPGVGEWGRWLRQIEVETIRGQVVMEGLDGRPLLILDRVGEGRVALLASDHAWLWSRGYEGGGPQLDLLRRLAHWMMKEPELEEEALWAEPLSDGLRIVRRSLAPDVGAVTVTHPDGTMQDVPLTEVSPGRFEAQHPGTDIGLYRLKEGALTSVVGLGPAAPREFEQTIADATILDPVLAPTGGGVFRLEDGLPQIRSVRPGRPAAGRGWLGLTPRGAYETLDIARKPLLPVWLVALLAGGLLIGAWLREGRR